MNVKLESLKSHFDRVIALRNASYVNGWYDPAKLDELNAEVQKIEPSPAYFAHLDAAVDGFVAELLASPEFHDMHDRWASLDTDTEQRAYLEKCVGRLAWHQAQIGVPTTIGNIRFYHCDDPDYASDAYVAFDNNVTARVHDDIAFNEARPRWTKDLAWALKTLVHEQTHVFNLSLNTQHHLGKIQPDHPLYGEAVYFNQHFTRNARIDFTHGRYAHSQRNPYLNQLDERAAFHSDARLQHLLESAFEDADYVVGETTYQTAGGVPSIQRHMRPH